MNKDFFNKKITMKNLLTLMCLCISVSFYAQDKQYFVKATDGYSHKKTSYLTLTDGTEIQGTIKNLNWKKGLFEEIKLKVDGKKVKYSAEDIAHMYLPQSGLDKLAKGLDFAYDATQWANKSDVNGELIQEGYAYFESAEVQIKKKKTQVLLLQVVNPAFNSKVKVFHDPYAKKTMGLGIGGINVAGGIDKSYWVQTGDKPAFKLKKKDYDETADMLFGDCDAYFETIKSNLVWKDFPMHVYDYVENCK